MYAWVGYRVRAKDSKSVINLIEHYSEVIRRPNSGHAYGFIISSIFKYQDNSTPVFGHLHDYRKNEELEWIKEVNTEYKFLEIIKHLRMRQLLFRFYHFLGDENKSVVDQLCSDYQSVSERELERAFLRKAVATLVPFAKKMWQQKNEGRYDCFEEFWKEYTSDWRSIKRHTSSFSFPFIRPGVDIYKAFAYEIGNNEDPIWYSNVYYHY
jgi:hypothetical protein